MLVKARELAKVFQRRTLVRLMRVYLANEESKTLPFPVDHDLSLPPIMLTVFKNSANSLQSRGGVYPVASILTLLRRGCESQIAQAIIQCIAVFMVNLRPSSYQAEKQTVHSDASLPPVHGYVRDGVIASGFWIPQRMPIPLHKEPVFCFVNDCSLISRQWNEAYSWVKRLDDLVAFHAVFHGSTLNGIVRPSGRACFLL